MALTQITSTGLADDAATGAKIPDNAINSEHYTDESIDLVHMSSDSVNESKLNISNAGSNGQFLQKQSGNTGGLTWADATAVGGATGVDFNDDIKVRFGTGNDLEIYHDGSTSFIKDVGTGNLEIWGDGNVKIKSGDGTETKATFDTNGSVDLYYDNSKKFETVTGGATVTGTCTATSFAGDGSSLTGIVSPLSFRNLVVNGAMNIAQRGTSSSGGSYKTVDRLQIAASGHEEYPTQSQQSTSSSDTGPWAKGFKKFYRVTNGNQTGGAGVGEEIHVRYKFEAQDIANSAWDYTDPNSKLTISFWVRSNVAQTYYVGLKTEDGTSKQYSFAYTPSANTWLKVEHTVPGHADLQFDSNNALGLTIYFFQFAGTNSTHSGASNGSWRGFDGGTVSLDQTSTWYTTNDATWDITGLQVEAGDTATEFEHRSFADELERCQRYYYHIPAPIAPGSHASFGNGYHFGLGFCNSTSNSRVHIPFPTTMRTNPASVEWSGTQGDYVVGHGGSETQCNGNISFSSSQAHNSRVNFPCSGLTAGQAIQGMAYNGSAFLGFEAEL